MKKILFLVIIFVVTFFVFTKIHAADKTQNATQKIVSHVMNVAQPTSVPTPTTAPITVGTPVTISIPALHVNAPIESVGMDAEGRMGVPDVETDTAWYKYGYKPGEQGSAVIDGHFDTPTGAPAVFYDLSKLQNGDTISVTDDQNKTYTFVVTQVTSYPYDQLPMQTIFASTDKARLNLITCDGSWNRSDHNYSNRAVIYSVLQQ